MISQKFFYLTILCIFICICIFIFFSIPGCVPYAPIPTDEPPTPIPTEEPTPTPEAPAAGYDHVLSIGGNGAVIYGSWNTAYNRIVNNLENVILRFDNRIAKPKYIEYAVGMIRFDFQSLDAVHDTWDAYAFVLIELDVKAGLGTNYRRGHDDHVWKSDTTQHPDQEWNTFTIDVYCEPESGHTLAASFNSGGGVVQGTWDGLYEQVVTKGADCKVKFDNRILMPPHIEYGDNYFNFDSLGLVAHHNGSDAYAYAHVTSGERAGIGTSYRRGIAGEVNKKDRDQYAEYEWIPMGFEVYCHDRYDEEFIFNSSANLLNDDGKTWTDLYNLVVYEARNCKLIYDNRVSTPSYIEYSNGVLQFDFTNLHAWHPGSDYYDSFALFYLAYDSQASLQACYRRAYAPIVFQKTTAQHQIAFTTDVPVRVVCEKGDGYSRELSVDGNGNAMYGSLDDLYGLLTTSSGMYNIKLRQDNRITIPEVIEYGDSPDDPVYFEYHTLAAYHNSWDCFASTYIHKGNPTGFTGSYRRGHDDTVWQRTLAQHAIYTPISQTDVDIFLQLTY
jgi:hypothetical protein